MISKVIIIIDISIINGYSTKYYIDDGSNYLYMYNNIIPTSNYLYKLTCAVNLFQNKM